MQFKFFTSPHDLPSNTTLLHDSFGFFDWDICDDKILICSYLSEILAFTTQGLTQDLSAWCHLTHPDDTVQMNLLIEQIKTKQTTYIVSENRKLCRDGQWRWFSLRGKVIDFDNNGNPLRATGTCIDTTKMKDDELNIKKLKENYSELDAILSFFIKHIPAPVAIFDAEMRHKFVSEAWKHDNNLINSNDFVGKTYYETYPEENGIWKENHMKALNGETIKWFQSKDTGYSEKTFWSDGVCAPWYKLDGSIGGIVMYSKDVTERVENENNLKIAIENLSCSNQSLERFAHICSHDLKEPLRGISNFIHLLCARNAEHFDEESLLYMRYTFKGIDRMSALIQNILMYSKFAGQTEFEKIPLDMNKIICEIKEIFDVELLKVSAKINIKKLPIILGEPTQINQLFTNLISNALKFRSSVSLVVEIFAIDKDSFWEFHVRDNGIGIEPEYSESIFTMFKRIHSRNQYEGSGIGLATCQKIVNDHHGEIHVQSVPEGGSDFVFTLPKMGVGM